MKYSEHILKKFENRAKHNSLEKKMTPFKCATDGKKVNKETLHSPKHSQPNLKPMPALF